MLDRNQLVAVSFVWLLALVMAGTTRANLIGHYRLDDNGNTPIVTDSAGHMDGTFKDATGNPFTSAHSSAECVGQALSFDGADDYIITPNTRLPLQLTNDFTIAFWIKPAAIQSNRIWATVFAVVREDPFLTYMLFCQFDEKGKNLVFSNRAVASLDNLMTEGNNNYWHHVAITYDHATNHMATYLDGAKTGGYNKMTISITAAGSAHVEIGASATWGGAPPRCFYKGMLADLRIYDQALDTAAIETLAHRDPALAWDPSPERQAGNIPLDMVLKWKAGKDARSHSVYFGVNQDAVKNAGATSPLGTYPIRQNLSQTTYAPAGLELDKTYYWRIDEIYGSGTNRPGEVWSFTTAEYNLIDDFESYRDDRELASQWKVTTGTGSTVNLAMGKVPDYGYQAMKVSYDNTEKPYYSEVERAYNTAQNWTTGNAGTLALCFKGQANITNMYVVLGDGHANAVVKAIDAKVQMPAGGTSGWHVWNIKLQEFSGCGVKLSNISRITIGFGNRNKPSAGDKGTVYLDDIRLYP